MESLIFLKKQVLPATSGQRSKPLASLATLRAKKSREGAMNAKEIQPEFVPSRLRVGSFFSHTKAQRHEDQEGRIIEIDPQAT